MTAGQSSRPLTKVSVAPATLAALLAATLLGGAMIGAGITLQLGSSAPVGTVADPAAIFDAPAFRAEEHRALPGAAFDAPAFRAEEHRTLPGAAFDAPAFRAEKHGPLGGP